MTHANNVDRAPALLRKARPHEQFPRMSVSGIRIGTARNIGAPRILLLCTLLALSTPAFAFFCFNFGFGGGGPLISTQSRQLPLIDPGAYRRAPYSKQGVHRMPPWRYLRPSHLYPPPVRWLHRRHRLPPALR